MTCSMQPARVPVGGPGSFVLRARLQDDGAMWPALAARCGRTLPARLRWAAVLLDAQHQRPVRCADTQVRELFRWLDARPNTQRVSVSCERTGARPR